MDGIYKTYLEHYKAQKKVYRNFIKGLRRQKNLDVLFKEAHEEAFDSIDCLKCANCCKTISPIFKQKDIERLAKHLEMKPYQFIENYLQEDNEGDFVLKESPCPFLLEDNMCAVYEQRPAACRAYPHTDHVNMKTHLSLAVKNCEVCPAVVKVLGIMKEKLT